jgi:hypothetical protein
VNGTLRIAPIQNIALIFWSSDQREERRSQYTLAIHVYRIVA